MRTIKLAVLVFGALGLISQSWSAEPAPNSANKSALVVKKEAAKKAPAAEKLDPEHAAKLKQGLALFKSDVRQVLSGRCVKCHGGEETEGEFDLNTREALLKGGAEGPSIVLGAGKKSHLYHLITQEEEPSMPEDGAKLTDHAIAAIAKWIDLGAPYDKPLVDKSADPLAWITEKIDPAARDYWAFQPLRKVSPPKVKNEAWIRTAIDRYVLAKLEEKGLTPNEIVDRRKLIRRAYLDLTGLPPTPEEITAFVGDKEPKAYERLIDRLLESPHYGERWARHWLDVARFGESHGFEQDYDREYAYHYRDFVIKALNQDMPYDQFVRWQLAGDEIAPDNPLALMATGFLGAGVFPTQLTEKEFEPARYDELDDMVSTLGTSMLGLTIGCVRCHTHKYDPIPQSDYYRLISVFATTIRSNIELDLDPEKTKRELAKWEKEHRPLAADLKQYEEQQLSRNFQNWLASRTSEDKPRPTWVVLDLNDLKSEGGATLKKLEDGSLLAEGANPDFDKYTFATQTHLRGITAIRLEALTHKSMVKGGPGRADNGNIGLGEFSLTATPLQEKGEAVAVKLAKANATFQQNTNNLSIASSIDGDGKTGWAVDPRFGKDQAAVFELAQPLDIDGGVKLSFTLQFNVNNKHNIGRPRLSISTQPAPVGFKDDEQVQAIAEILAGLDQSGGKLDDKDRARLLAWYKTIDAQWAALNKKVQDHLGAKPKPGLTKVMVASEGFKPIPHHADGRGFPHFYKDIYFLKRGDIGQKTGIAEPSFLQVLMRAPEGAKHWQVDPPAGWRTSYRRTALANWITDSEYGPGHLLARVVVNRLWQHHLGQGIVATPSDFGAQSLRPTHPDLLEHLASELIAAGWSLKAIHKQIMTSAVYMQSTRGDAEDVKKDPENQWLWRRTPRRLEAEVIRDMMLSVSGDLDKTMYGPGSLDPAHKRRSIYFMIKRSQLIPMMQLFDMPAPLVGVGGRPSTTIAPQALMFMNNAQVRNFALSFAKRLAPAADKSLSDAISQSYLIALGRKPDKDELADGVAFLESQIKSYADDHISNGRDLALADFCQVLMSLNEFVYVD